MFYNDADPKHNFFYSIPQIIKFRSVVAGAGKKTRGSGSSLAAQIQPLGFQNKLLWNISWYDNLYILEPNKNKFSPLSEESL